MLRLKITRESPLTKKTAVAMTMTRTKRMVQVSLLFHAINFLCLLIFYFFLMFGDFDGSVVFRFSGV